MFVLKSGLFRVICGEEICDGVENSVSVVVCCGQSRWGCLWKLMVMVLTY